jgi:hypothetical protein
MEKTMGTNRERIDALEQALSELISAIKPFYPLLAKKYLRILHPPEECAPTALDHEDSVISVVVGPEDDTLRFDRVGDLERRAFELKDKISQAHLLAEGADPEAARWRSKLAEWTKDLAAVEADLNSVNTRPPTEEPTTNRHFSME